MLPFPSSPPARISLLFSLIFSCHEELEDASSLWKMILLRIFRFLGVKKSWVLVVDNEGNTFWCAKYESIVGRKCFWLFFHVTLTPNRSIWRKRNMKE